MKFGRSHRDWRPWFPHPLVSRSIESETSALLFLNVRLRTGRHSTICVRPTRSGDDSVQCLEYSKMRLAAFLEEIQRLRGSEFAYVHSEHALGLIEASFSGYLTQLGKLTTSS